MLSAEDLPKSISWTNTVRNVSFKERIRKETILRTFHWVIIDKGNCEITPVQTVEARSFGHAMQKLAAAFPTSETEIWRIEIWTNR